MKRTVLKRKTRLRRVGARGERIREEVDEVRAEKLKKAGKKPSCEGCGAAPPLHLHHLRPRSRGGLHSGRNTILVCFPCHVWIHREPLKARAEGWTK